jgi:hypothetical protein
MSAGRIFPTCWSDPRWVHLTGVLLLKLRRALITQRRRPSLEPLPSQQFSSILFDHVQTVLVQIGSTSMRVPDALYNLQARSTAFQTAGVVRP